MPRSARRVFAAVLAAGESRRMGRVKPLLPWGETTILGQILHNLLASQVGEVWVVTGFEAGAVGAVAADFGARVLFNPSYASGEMLSSLQVAVRALPARCSGVLVVLADQPLIPTAIFDQVIAAFDDDQERIVAPTYKGQRGHPVLIGRRFFAELLGLAPGSAPRDLLQAHEAAFHLLAVESEAVLLDLDRPGEYERYRPRQAGEEPDAEP
ncbi:MAG: nucleotidyltransferase family protein [Anaerolineae bacterium]|nr:nucleotidyltransferase family protein [Anaerolineae bacterium]